MNVKDELRKIIMFFMFRTTYRKSIDEEKISEAMDIIDETRMSMKVLRGILVEMYKDAHKRNLYNHNS